MSPANHLKTSLFYSLSTHTALLLGIGFYLIAMPPRFKGGAGLMGAGRTKLTLLVQTSAPTAKNEITKPKLEKLLTQLKSDIVIPVKNEDQTKPKLAKSLPHELKSKNLKVIPQKVEDTIKPTQAQATRKESGNDPDAEASVLGQGGTGQFAVEVMGSGDDSNALGEHLQNIVRATQRELESPGSLMETKTTLIEMHVLESGVVDVLKVSQSSGEKRLDLLALDAVKRAQPYQPYHQTLKLKLPVIFNVAGKSK